MFVYNADKSVSQGKICLLIFYVCVLDIKELVTMWQVTDVNYRFLKNI